MGPDPRETTVKKKTIGLLLAGGILASTAGLAGATPPPAGSPLGQEVPEIAQTVPDGRGWIAKRSDNICGLQELNQLSNPARVDYDALLKATPQMKEMKRRGVDPDSPEGIRLKNAAVDLVADCCEQIRSEEGHCSVWKSIRHKDGRSVSDVTRKVEERIGQAPQ